jgi:hypothetical protein
MKKVIEVEALAEVPKLYYVSSTGIVNGFHDVPIDWIALRSPDDLSLDLPWAAIIKGYDAANPATRRPMHRVAEMFTEPEARGLVEYLERTNPEGAPIMEPVELPVPTWLVSTEEWVGACDNRFIFRLSDQKDYGLPFQVGGYCRLAARILIREEKSAGFVVYSDGTPISTPFADRGAAEAWKGHLLPEQSH